MSHFLKLLIFIFCYLGSCKVDNKSVESFEYIIPKPDLDSNIPQPPILYYAKHNFFIENDSISYYYNGEYNSHPIWLGGKVKYENIAGKRIKKLSLSSAIEFFRKMNFVDTLETLYIISTKDTVHATIAQYIYTFCSQKGNRYCWFRRETEEEHYYFSSVRNNVGFVKDSIKWQSTVF